MDVFAANDLAAFSVVSGSATETATAGRFDASYCAKALFFNSGSARSAQFINPDTGATVSLTDGWLHFECYNGTSGAGGGTVMELINSSGTSVIRLQATTAQIVRLDYWNGSAWVTGASTFNAFGAGSQLKSFDLHFVCGASGSLDLYVGNSLALSVSGLNAAVTNAAWVQFNSWSLSVGSAVSQVLVSDATTVGAKIGSLTFNANGANTAWSGDYLNIVKTGFDDTTFISSSSAGDKESYGASDTTMPSGFSVSSVFFGVRGRLGGSSPTNIKPLIRRGATDYTTGYNFPGLNSTSFANSVGAFSVDPSTSSTWLIANVNGGEPGFQSAA